VDKYINILHRLNGLSLINLQMLLDKLYTSYKQLNRFVNYHL